MGKLKILITFCFAFIVYQCTPQRGTSNLSKDKMIEVADRMLVYQRSSGGWPKSYHDENRKEFRVNYYKPLTEGTDEEIKANYDKNDATYDNWATTKEIRFLLNAFKEVEDKRYLQAAERGIKYVLEGQYQKSGGWPQYYPKRKGYYEHITFNDELTSNMLNIVYDVVHQLNGFEAVDQKLIAASKLALAKGLSCILNTQIVKEGIKTVWCAQHDRNTLDPMPARAFELASYSGKESIYVLQFLMRFDDPSEEIIAAVKAGALWFENHKIEGYDCIFIKDETKPRGRDRVLVEKPGNTIWARFYDLETEKPIFVGRDGIKRDKLIEIEAERRSGYGYYGDWPKQFLSKEYPQWLKKINRS